MAVLPGLANPALLTAQELYAPSSFWSEALSKLTLPAPGVGIRLEKVNQ